MKRILFITALLVSSLAIAKDNVMSDKVWKKANALNVQAKSKLGVDIRSLTFIFQAGPGRFLLKDSMVDDGSWPHLQSLEKSGYVKLSSHPDAGGELINIQLTPKGELVLYALVRP